MSASVTAQSRRITVVLVTELARESPLSTMLRFGAHSFGASSLLGFKLVIKEVDVRFVTFATGQAEIEWSTFEHPCTSKRGLLFIIALFIFQIGARSLRFPLLVSCGGGGKIHSLPLTMSPTQGFHPVGVTFHFPNL